MSQRNRSHVHEILGELHWPTSEVGRKQASLAFCHKKKKNTLTQLTWTDQIKTSGPRHARAPHDLQYTLMPWSIFPDHPPPLWHGLHLIVVAVATKQESNPSFNLPWQRCAFKIFGGWVISPNVGKECCNVLVKFVKVWFHYENTPMQIYWKFHLQKLKLFR